MAIGRFEVPKGERILLKVTTGDGQPGGISVRMNAQLLAEGIGSLEHDLGDGSALRGQTLLVDVATRQSHGATVWVSAQIELSTAALQTTLDERRQAQSGETLILPFSVRFH